MMRIVLIIVLLFSSFFGAVAQELSCEVSVIAPTLQGNSANEEIIASLKASVFEFMNETKWTTDNFKPEERIECNILINISKVISADVYEGSIQVSSSRPVFKSNYKTRLLNQRDKNIRFKYMRNTSFVYRPNSISEGIIDVLAYYAYMIIGLDYDSFALKGGQPYFLQAQQIVSNYSNNQEDKGWSAKFLNNRFHLVNNVLQDNYEPLRKCYYDYHMNGMDILYDKKDEGVNNMLKAVKLIEEVYKIRPGSFNIQSFFNAKSDELVNIYIKSPSTIRLQAFSLFAKLDPGHITQYNAIKNGKR